MKIAYLGQMADVATENGISKKIRAQAMHWRGAGCDVRYFSLVPSPAVWPGLSPLPAELIVRGHPLQRIARSLHLARQIRAWRPDVIYFRYAYHSAGLPALFRAVPTVAELNSDDLAEYPVTLSAAKLLYHRLTRRRILAACRAFVPVTHELDNRFRAFAKPSCVIANGLDLAEFPPAPPPDAHAPLRLVFVGSAGTPWHGLDRIAELASLFPDARFDVIGTEPFAAPPNVTRHPHLARAAYTPLLHQATAALGTLALFRKSMDEACPLKVREYLAAGLPVLAAYRDTDVPEGADYFLRLANNDAPLAPERDRIAAWLGRWRGRRVPREAIQHLDTSVKEARRLAFLREAAGQAA